MSIYDENEVVWLYEYEVYEYIQMNEMNEKYRTIYVYIYIYNEYYKSMNEGKNDCYNMQYRGSKI